MFSYALTAVKEGESEHKSNLNTDNSEYNCEVCIKQFM